MKASDKLPEQSIFLQLVWFALITSIAITIFEMAKYLLLRDLNNWQSHAATITFNSLIAGMVLLFIIKKYAEANSNLVKEIDQLKQTQADLKQSEEKFRLLLEYSPVAVAVCDQNEKVLYLNQKFTEIFGYSQKDISAVNDWYSLAYPDEAYRRKIMGKWGKAFQKSTHEGAEIHHQETTVTCKNGATRDVEAKIAPILDINILILNDITERNKFRKLISQGKKEWEETFNSMNDAITIHDKNFTVIRANTTAKKIFGLPFSKVIGQKCYELYHGAEAFPGKCTCLDVLKTGKPSVTEMFEPHLNKYIEIKAFPLFANNNKISKLVHVVKDITYRKKIEEELRSFAITDELTGLYNLRGFNTMAIQQVTMAKRRKKGMILISVDLDKLKAINDVYGHAEGDRALIRIANILKDSFRESDLIARTGDDEFVVLQIEDNAATPEVVTSRLLRNLELSNSKGEHTYYLSISIGVAHCLPESAYTINNLLMTADKRMYKHKAVKRNL